MSLKVQRTIVQYEYTQSDLSCPHACSHYGTIPNLTAGLLQGRAKLVTGNLIGLVKSGKTHNLAKVSEKSYSSVVLSHEFQTWTELRQ